MKPPPVPGQVGPQQDGLGCTDECMWLLAISG